jgi:transcriptional regulator with XRE-family HTH domain
MVAESTRRDPGFPKLYREAIRRRKLGEALARARKSKGFTQTEVARRMESTQSVVSGIELGANVRISTVLRYVDAVGAHDAMTVALKAKPRLAKPLKAGARRHR